MKGWAVGDPIDRYFKSLMGRLVVSLYIFFMTWEVDAGVDDGLNERIHVNEAL